MRRVAALLAGLLAVTAIAAQPSAARLKQPTAKSALNQLVRLTNHLPAKAAGKRNAGKRKKARLKAAAHAARRNLGKHPCTSVRRLSRFRTVLHGIKVPKQKRLARRLRALGPVSMNASRALLASRKTRRCGGGVKPSKLETARTTILQNDANGMRLKVDLPALRFVDAQGGGHTWTKLVLPNTDTPAPPGSPGIPVVSKVLGVPDGATVDVAATQTSSYKIGGVDVFPSQPEPVDQGGNVFTQPPNFHAPPFATPPFQIDHAEYRQHETFPPKPADGLIVGRSRDLTIGSLQLPAAQYSPASRTLKVVNSITVAIAFRGGSHTFPDVLESPWERAQRSLRDSLLNGPAIRGGVPPVHERCGAEMLVITNPSTLAAANQFADGKRAQGMRTLVAQTGTGAGQIGDTPSAIQTYIRDRLNATRCVHPSYVTILGDDELVPVFPGINGIESDLQYSLRDDTDELPDVAVGRIVGDDATQVTTAVTKILGYENSPPPGDWLRKATIAADFQDDNADGQEERTFSRFAEVARTGILHTPGGFGLSADRIYNDDPSTTPLKFDDGTDLPSAIKKPDFGWDGSTADITSAWNQGRYLVIHRDHGWSQGWSTPSFTSSNVDALTNGARLPLVLSINCSSGGFQKDDTAFATRALVNPNGGAVGVFGDTEDSPSWHNTQIAWGFLDALLPRVLDGEGPATPERAGYALINGKTRLAGLAPPATDGNTRNELYLWHFFGDPSMQMRGGTPLKIPQLPRFDAVFTRALPPEPDPPPYGVQVSLPAEFNGQAFSLLRNGDVVGKGVAGDGRAIIPADFDSSQPHPGELAVAFEGDGAVPITIPVSGIPRDPTTLSIQCPRAVTNNATATIHGTLSPAFAGARIDLTYQARDNGAIVKRTATTDANGNWSDAFDTGPANDPGGLGDGGAWSVSARYAGDSAHEPSGPQACSFIEASN